MRSAQIWATAEGRPVQITDLNRVQSTEALPRMTDRDSVAKVKQVVNWPLRIGLLVVLFIFWVFALGFVESIKQPIRDGFMQQVQQGAELSQTARTYAVTIGFIKGAVDLGVVGLAILFWRITRKKGSRGG